MTDIAVTIEDAQPISVTIENAQPINVALGEAVNIYQGGQGTTDYNELENLPVLGTAAATDSTDYATAAQGTKADTAVQPGDLATVATTGDYTDLINTPAPFDPGSLAEVATTGSYIDLSDKPSLFSGDYSDLLNRPTLFSGSYVDLTNKPSLFDGAYGSLTGVPTTFTPSAHNHVIADITDFGNYATQSDIDTSIAALVDTAPTTLNTLNELAAALGDDPNFATTVTNSLASKIETLTDLGLTATATELNYVDGVTSGIQGQLDDKANASALASYLPLAGGTLTGGLTGTDATFSGTISEGGSSLASRYVGLTATQSIGGIKTFTGTLNSTGTTQLRNTQPTNNLTFSLGSSSLYWSNLYTQNVHFNSTASISGSTAGQLDATGRFSVTANGVPASSQGLNVSAYPGSTGTTYGMRLRLIGSTASGTYIGLLGQTYFSGNGTLTKGTGAMGTVTYQSTSTGTLQTANAFESDINNVSTAGVITNAVSYRANTPVNSGGGSITNVYGLYVEDMNVGTALNYAIYTNAGKVRLGDETTIHGNLLFDANLTRNIASTSAYASNAYIQTVNFNSTASISGTSAGRLLLTGTIGNDMIFSHGGNDTPGMKFRGASPTRETAIDGFNGYVRFISEANGGGTGYTMFAIDGSPSSLPTTAPLMGGVSFGGGFHIQTGFGTSGSQGGDFIIYAGAHGGSTTAEIGRFSADGDMELAGTGDGVILKSPDGTRYRVTVANGGTLSVSAA